MIMMGFCFGVMIQCYGSFPLVRTVYKFNGSIGDQSKAGGVVRSIVMIILTIIPVYGISFLADAFILNSIEFWTGKKMTLSINDNPLIEMKEEGDRLSIHSKIYHITFYAFRDKPGQFFILQNNQYVPVQSKIEKNKIYILDQNQNIILTKELSEKELTYIN